MKNVLVTGGAGYVGSHVCAMLAKLGYNPIVFDNLSTGWSDLIKFGPAFIGDLRNYEDLERVFLEYDISAVMHFAAKSLVGESWSRKKDYWENNVLGTINLLDVCEQFGVNKAVFSSTCAVYGEKNAGIITEELYFEPGSPYGQTKKAMEDVINSYQSIDHVILRYFNVCGADPDGRIGEFHYPETHLIPLALEAALGFRSALQIFGSDYDTHDGTCVRDYVHVCDIAAAHIHSLRYLSGGGSSVDVNLGSSKGFSVKEVVDEIESVTNRHVPVVLVDRRPGDPALLRAASDRAKTLLGWEPMRSDLTAIISDAHNWMCSDGYKALSKKVTNK